MGPSTLLLFLLSSLLPITITANPLQLNLPPLLVHNTTNLYSETHCFERTVRRRLAPTSFNDCHHALEQLIHSKPIYEYHVRHIFSQNLDAAENVWKLPIHERNGSCEITLSTRNYEDVAAVTLAEIHDNLMEEGKGVLRECLFSPWPLGGTTSLGRPDALVIEVLGVGTFGHGVAVS